MARNRLNGIYKETLIALQKDFKHANGLGNRMHGVDERGTASLKKEQPCTKKRECVKLKQNIDQSMF